MSSTTVETDFFFGEKGEELEISVRQSGRELDLISPWLYCQKSLPDGRKVWTVSRWTFAGVEIESTKSHLTRLGIRQSKEDIVLASSDEYVRTEHVVKVIFQVKF